jgi:hypothetical protein
MTHGRNTDSSPVDQAAVDQFRALLAALRDPEPRTPGQCQDLAVRVGPFVVVPFLQFDVEIRKIVCTTNAIESVNARIRKAVRACGYFPSDQAALKCAYLAVMSLDPTGSGPQAVDHAMEGRTPARRSRT